MSRVYLVSGLGADKRLFKNISLPGHEVMLTDWLTPDKNDTLTSYAEKLIIQNDIKDNDVVIGVSLGGMIAVEIAKQVKLNKVILISSIKTDSEAPWYFQLFRRLPVYDITPGNLFPRLGFLIRPLFGRMAPADLDLFKDMLKNSSPVFLKWAMRAVLYWKNDILPDHLYHIIGDKDLVFPYKNIKDPTAIIKGGTHIMVFDKADEINLLLAGILNK
jgi:pimeloyl-ACP methyl ester carboxylesterase